MDSLDRYYRYVAVSPAGRRVKGAIAATSDAEAFAQLRRDGFAPLKLKPARSAPGRNSKARPLTDRESADLLGSLADLLAAGADMRTAINILGARAHRPAVAAVCQGLINDIASGDPLDQAFGRWFVRHQLFVAAMIAAAEASGDLAGGLARTAEMIEARLKLQEKLISVLAYPTFVLISSILAVFALLIFVIPTLAPLAVADGATPPLSLGVMIAASDFLRKNASILMIVLCALLVLTIIAAQLGVLRRLTDRLLLDGPLRRTSGALVFGAFAVALGGMLSAGAPMSETLRLAVRAVGSKLARARLEPVLEAVREGQTLSSALETVSAFPTTIARLAAVGEATGALGPMLMRGGRMEEEAAMRRIGTFGQVLGPVLIVTLGGLVGLLMAGLLSGVSQLGQSALQ